MNILENSHRSYQKVRIFVASPADVFEERDLLEVVIKELNKTGGIADYVGLTLELLDWRTHVSPQSGMRAEEVILEDLPVKTWDIFVGILWLRFGTVSGGIRAATAEPFESGTEEEFWRAFDSFKAYGRPKVLFYRCTRLPEALKDIDPGQLMRVNKFFEEFGSSLSHPGLHQEFKTPADFERRVRSDLERLMLQFKEEVLHNIEPVPRAIMEFSGLETHETLPRRDYFFGREDEIKGTLHALDPAQRGWGAVIDGIGGIGKTALAIEIAYLCKEQGLFDTFLFVTAKQDLLKTHEIRKQQPSATCLDDFINESARAIGHGYIARLGTLREKRRALKNALNGRRALLIFDNLETLATSEREAVNEFVNELPQDCKAIITSRWQVHESGSPIRLEQLRWSEAKELIGSQVARYGPELIELTRAGEDGWKQLYEHAGGSPLVILHAIGLIRMRKLPLQKALEVIRDGSKESDLNTFIFSFTVSELDQHEKLTLQALSLFGGVADLDALAAVTGLGQVALEEIILQRLIGFSLVNWVGKQQSQEVVGDHYGLHPLTKRLAYTLLMEDEEAAQSMKERFIDYWHKFAKKCDASEETNYDAFEKLEAEWPNLEVTIRFLLDGVTQGKEIATHKNGKQLIEFALLLRVFLKFSGRFEEDILLCSKGYEEAKVTHEWVRAGWCAHDVAYDKYSVLKLKDPTDSSYTSYSPLLLNEASNWTDKAEQAWQKSGSKREQIALYRIKALLAQQRKHYSQAAGFFKKCFRLEMELELETSAASTLDQLSALAAERKKYKLAKRYLTQALEISAKHEDREGEAVYRANFGALALEEKNWTEAIDHFKSALDISRELGLIELSAGTQHSLARALAEHGDISAALSYANNALGIYDRLHSVEVAELREFIQTLERGNPTSIGS